jgi:hypothetical protein
MAAEDQSAIRRLEPLIGDWSIKPDFPDAPPIEGEGRTSFEWMPGEQFVIQRWQAPDPAPSGIAVIGFDRGRGTLLQHYFDSRGVARLYEMNFQDGVWELRRQEPDFSPLDFHQRFRGRLSEDGRTISGRWEISGDGRSWEHDFDLVYTRLG